MTNYFTRPLPTDTTALRILFSNAARDASRYLLESLEREPMREFSSDDTDYNPAASTIADKIMQHHYFTNKSMLDLFDDNDFLLACTTANFDTELFDYLDFEIIDELDL